jgi:hypothetical protein
MYDLEKFDEIFDVNPIALRQAANSDRRRLDPRDPNYMDDEEFAEHYGIDIEDLPN